MKCVARTMPYDTRSKDKADCESLRLFKRSMATGTLGNNLSFTNALENDGEPKGTPRMHTSSVGTRTTPDSCKGHGL